ncbi:LuxR C-terminal-related transcriptional regulator [Shewanella sp.]|uniref:LuxR C-terminal-related transcriptional regulator n=1 Tax=Shewanella sp. TaxID=50422 RepID=UPI003D138A28
MIPVDYKKIAEQFRVTPPSTPVDVVVALFNNELSTRECEVLLMSSWGMNAEDIANSLDVGSATIREYLNRARIKVGVKTLNELRIAFSTRYQSLMLMSHFY